MSGPRVAVVGVGSFGRNHLRVLHELEQTGRAKLAGVLDADATRTAEATTKYGCPVFASLEELSKNADAAVVATPTVSHKEIGCGLMELGLDVLVEKPLAPSVDEGRALVDTAEKHGRILQVGHLERFNPAVVALEKVMTHPLFFEIHRMSEFSPRSLDVDVVLDLMIHDIDIVLSLVKQRPEEIRAAGIAVLSERPDIANVRLQFPGGCIANLTASRVSTERVRKLRLFQPHEYISVDYHRKDGVRFKVKPPMAIDFQPLSVTRDEPLRLELEDFVDAVATRRAPKVTGKHGLDALEVACDILMRIEAHAQLVKSAIGVAS
jgi:predicted dehydrogenase